MALPDAPLWAFARELAPKVARAEVRLVIAQEALDRAALRYKREGRLGELPIAEVVAGLRQELARHLEPLERAAGEAEHRVKQALRAPIARHDPYASLLEVGQAASAGVLSEAQVEGVVRTEVYWALPPARRGGFARGR